MFSEPCSGNKQTPMGEACLRFLCAATGTVGGGYGGYALTADQNIWVIILATVGLATVGNKVGIAVGKGTYHLGSKAITMFKEKCCNPNANASDQTTNETQPLVKQTQIV